MQLIGQTINHGTFGKGIVTDWIDTTITICFSAGEKKFLYPDAFSKFLHLKNAAMQKEEDFLGRHCENGVIHAHPMYRLQLRAEDQILFWPYVVQEPEKQRWGKTVLKYMTNKIGEQILFDLKEQLLRDESRECAEAFYMLCLMWDSSS